MIPGTLRSLVLTALAALALSALVSAAEAQSQCRYLEMRLMQLRAGNHRGAEMDSVLGMMGNAGCPGYQSYKLQPRREASTKPTGPSTYRTLCVRSCDGYYFPISFSTTQQHLQDDAAICQQRCPTGDAQLYYHPRNQGPESMRSIDGAAYTDLPNAFRYRTTLDTSCTCGTPLVGPDPLAIDPLANPGAYLQSLKPPAAPRIASAPEPRSVPGLDPETLANRDGGLSPAEVKQEQHTPEGSDGVRVILPGWNTALRSDVLLTPVPN